VATTLPLTQRVTSQQVQEAISARESNVLDLSLPVYVSNELPNPPAESPLVIQTGNENRLDIITVNEQVIQLQDTEGFRLSVSSTDRQGELSRVNTKGAIVVERENFITVTGEGFKAGSDVVAWLFSEPRRLGVLRVSSDGTFEESVQIGADVPVGDHTTQVNGITETGELRSLTLAVEVIERSTESDLYPVVAMNEASEASASSSVGVGVLALVAVVSAGVGALIVLGMRRRRDQV